MSYLIFNIIELGAVISLSSKVNIFWSSMWNKGGVCSGTCTSIAPWGFKLNGCLSNAQRWLTAKAQNAGHDQIMRKWSLHNYRDALLIVFMYIKGFKVCPCPMHPSVCDSMLCYRQYEDVTIHYKFFRITIKCVLNRYKYRNGGALFCLSPYGLSPVACSVTKTGWGWM